MIWDLKDQRCTLMACAKLDCSFSMARLQGSEIDFSNDGEPDKFEFDVGYNDAKVDIIRG